MSATKCLRSERQAVNYRSRHVRSWPGTLTSTRRLQQLHKAVDAAGETATTAGVPAQAAQLISTLKEAASTSKVPPVPLLEAILALEAQKLPADGWLDQIQAPGRKWRLVFSSGSENSTAAGKKQPHKGGSYFPIPACQRYQDSVFTNGVFLGPIFYLTFEGPFAMKGRRLEFDVVKMVVGLGPISLPFTIKKSSPLTDENSDKAERGKLPFFLFAYADEDIVVARGRGGGVAMWARTTADWEAKSGVLQVYK